MPKKVAATGRSDKLFKSAFGNNRLVIKNNHVPVPDESMQPATMGNRIKALQPESKRAGDPGCAA